MSEVLAFHRSLPGYEPTPLHSLGGVAAGLGLRAVWLKDESDRLGLPAFKVLGASWAVERLLRERPDVTTLVAASAGNHGRAVARVARLRGLRARILLPARAGRGRVEAIAAEGAAVMRVDGGYEAALAAADAAAAEPGAALVADVGEDPADRVPGWVVEGYSTLFAEVDAQVPEPPDVVLVPAGVGSLAAAAVAWAARRTPPVRAVAVEPATAACIGASLAAGRPVTVETPGTTMAGLDCARPSGAAWPALRDGLAGAVAVGDAQAHAAMRELAALGLEIGDCGAAPLAALRAGGVARPGERVLLIGTEGASDPGAYRAIVG
ncbi:MAG TPA: pyridoxal-phosphate dependent enzyme [Solirubrobacteraceae bacterium]|nr:pyridoxal-phosphate dependent enzyme [Solirubrobacteraceae bacterium]